MLKPTTIWRRSATETLENRKFFFELKLCTDTLKTCAVYVDGSQGSVPSLSPGASRAYCMISSDAFLPRDPAWGRSEPLPSFQPDAAPWEGGRGWARARRRKKREKEKRKKRGERAECVHVPVCPVRRQIGTYNHRDYLVLGIDYGFA